MISDSVIDEDTYRVTDVCEKKIQSAERCDKDPAPLGEVNQTLRNLSLCRSEETNTEGTGDGVHLQRASCSNEACVALADGN